MFALDRTVTDVLVLHTIKENTFSIEFISSVDCLRCPCLPTQLKRIADAFFCFGSHQFKVAEIGGWVGAKQKKNKKVKPKEVKRGAVDH